MDLLPERFLRKETRVSIEPAQFHLTQCGLICKQANDNSYGLLNCKVCCMNATERSNECPLGDMNTALTLNIRRTGT
jgi:hypothetical protein